MRISTMTTAIAAPAILLLALAGCAGGAGGGDGAGGADGGSGGTAAPVDGGGAGAGCVVGTWALDTDDLGAQLEAYIESSSGNATTVAMGGGQELVWSADGSATFTTDLTVTVTTALDDGIEFVITQQHTGGTSGMLALSGDVATPSGWDDHGYTVSNQVTVNGVPTDVAAVPVEGFGFDAATPLTVTCDGDRLATHTDPSFATQHWTRAG